MRANLLLESLAEEHALDLWCLPLTGAFQPPASFSNSLIDGFVVADLEFDPGWFVAQHSGPEALRRRGLPSVCRYSTHRAVETMRRRLEPIRYRMTLVLRSYLLPFVIPIERAGGDLGVRIVDLDDDEATTHRRLAEVETDARRAERYRLDADLFESYEAAQLPWADHLLVAQEKHAEQLRCRLIAPSVRVLRNAVDVQTRQQALRAGNSSRIRLRLLFVGNLSYLPNRAAARELALVLLPKLRRKNLDVELRLVGHQPSADVVALEDLEGVELLTEVQDLGPLYEWADQVLLPLRAGGGTRIKILEAFAAGVPVVTTAMGADGLDVKHGEHLLIAESAEHLSRISSELAVDEALRQHLVGAASEWVSRHHDRRRTIRELSDWFCSLAPKE